MTKKWFVPFVILAALALLAAVTAQAGSPAQEPNAPSAALSTAFTYQGQLNLDGQPVDSTCDFQFSLYDDEQGNTQIGATQTVSGVQVAGGLFTVQLDFGTAAFQGDARWLGIEVQCQGDASYADLGLQELTATPYALYALGAPWGGISDMPAGFADGVDDVGADWSLAGNTDTDSSGHFLGTTDEMTLTLAVSGKPGLRLVPTGNTLNIIGGSEYNTVMVGVVGAVIGGGGSSDQPNRVTGDYATVGGGKDNIASGYNSTIGGGNGNTVGDTCTIVGGGCGNTASGYASTVGGGNGNTASAANATVGGGQSNIASNTGATVGGGWANTASGYASTIAGGLGSTAAGWYSFAAGRRAQANNAGCFVWGDSYEGDVACNNDNRWVARASGGVYFYTNVGLTTGVYVGASGGSWSSLSDREVKENIESIDPKMVLERVVQIPVSTWNYIGEEKDIRHIGPMAQDFYAAFGLGDSERHINSLDADGVALAAIQGLYAQNQTLTGRIEKLEDQNADLEARLSVLENRVCGGSTASPVQAGLLPGAGFLLAGSLGLWLVRRREEKR